MRKVLSLVLILLVSMGTVYAKNPKKTKTDKQENNKASYRVSCIAFYNLENLFDTIHDEGKNDYEYLPNGGMHWDSYKYENKIKNMAYAISRFGEDVVGNVGAACVGVSEVENMRCMEDLAAALGKLGKNYVPILIEGPDRRGVDVGFLYNPVLFTPTNTVGYELNAHYADGGVVKTRLQLLISGYLQGEKIHIIVNHWPSRYGGELSSRPARDTAAMLTKHICDSLYLKDEHAKIVIMGDLNDDPFNHSCKEVLGARKERTEVEKRGYYNTMWNLLDRGIGSLAYNGSWNLFDQIIISEPLLNADPKKEWSFYKPEVFNKDFLTVQEGKDKGTPLRTHKSGIWQNGYGDHYPTMIYLIKQK